MMGERHALSKHPLYKVWDNMKLRCYNENCLSYKDYGGRGITICKSWRDAFSNFYNWAISNGYESGLSIDRKNNNRGYMPSNCRFVTQAENTRNRGCTKLDWEKVRDIRNSNVSPNELTIIYGVSRSHIGNILKNRFWRE